MLGNGFVARAIVRQVASNKLARSSLLFSGLFGILRVCLLLEKVNNYSVVSLTARRNGDGPTNSGTVAGKRAHQQDSLKHFTNTRSSMWCGEGRSLPTGQGGTQHAPRQWSGPSCSLTLSAPVYSVNAISYSSFGYSREIGGVFMVCLCRQYLLTALIAHCQKVTLVYSGPKKTLSHF